MENSKNYCLSCRAEINYIKFDSEFICCYECGQLHTIEYFHGKSSLVLSDDDEVNNNIKKFGPTLAILHLEKEIAELDNEQKWLSKRPISIENSDGNGVFTVGLYVFVLATILSFISYYLTILGITIALVLWGQALVKYFESLKKGNQLGKDNKKISKFIQDQRAEKETTIERLNRKV